MLMNRNSYASPNNNINNNRNFKNTNKTNNVDKLDGIARDAKSNNITRSKNNHNNNSNTGSNNNKRVQKINNLDAANNNKDNRSLETYLMNAKNPSLRRWIAKSSAKKEHSSNSKNNNCRKWFSKNQKPMTPARKRSSLARPVRVYDSSFDQERRPIAADWQEVRHRRNTHRQNISSMDRVFDDLVEIQVDEEVTTWPIRLRLGEMFEVTLPRCKRWKKHKRRRLMITTMTEKTMKSMIEARSAGKRQHGFKDTDRLLKVLSINNVDQENRYNVTRCSVM